MQTRRRFLSMLIAGAFGAVFPARAQISKLSVNAAIVAKLSALLENNTSALVIGKTYRLLSKGVPTDLSSEAQALLAYLNLSKEAFLNLGNKALLLHINSTIGQDFAKGHVEQLNGWLLSKTEIQLCRVLSLIPMA